MAVPETSCASNSSNPMTAMRTLTTSSRQSGNEKGECSSTLCRRYRHESWRYAMPPPLTSVSGLARPRVLKYSSRNDGITTVEGRFEKNRMQSSSFFTNIAFFENSKRRLATTRESRTTMTPPANNRSTAWNNEKSAAHVRHVAVPSLERAPHFVEKAASHSMSPTPRPFTSSASATAVPGRWPASAKTTEHANVRRNCTPTMVSQKLLEFIRSST
mmetsp:Transcript_26608/g.106601  ORF Transcript_26608/g.106601 Transcript_26608/m.106601 type:complete len:216 (+) Transcript_26608:2147-2794(+)